MEQRTPENGAYVAKTYSKSAKFFSGFFFTIVLVYLIIFFIVCGYNGFSGIGLILLYSFYWHFLLFPFVIYSIGGVIFLRIPNEKFPLFNMVVWKWLTIGCFICFGWVGLSALLH